MSPAGFITARTRLLQRGAHEEAAQDRAGLGISHGASPSLHYPSVASDELAHRSVRDRVLMRTLLHCGWSSSAPAGLELLRPRGALAFRCAVSEVVFPRRIRLGHRTSRFSLAVSLGCLPTRGLWALQGRTLKPHDSSTGPASLLTTDQVAQLLGVPLRELTWWIWALNESKRYDRFEIARRRGGETREIDAPIKPIKDLQRRLAGLLASWYRPRVQVHGFVAGRSPGTNATPHRRQQWVLRLDLEDFFPSINFGRVPGLFMGFPFEYPPSVATLLAQLCCHQNRLPQGAPTSPIISNYICRGMDVDLARLARDERCHYTRYADDLCISTDRTVFPSALATAAGGVTEAGGVVTAIVESNGFKLNPLKSNLMRRTQRQRVTGLVVNEKVNVPRSYVRSLRSLLYIWSHHGETDASAALALTNPHPNWPPGKAEPEFRCVVRGRVDYVGSVKGWTDPVYLALAGALTKVDGDYRPKAPPPLPTGSVRLFTEGESDGLHMAAAQRYFHARGEFLGLDLVWEPLEKTGDKELLKQCEALSRSAQNACCVCLFDRDDPAIHKKALNMKEWKGWGNAVVAVGILAPPVLPSGTDVCIELLHPPEVLDRYDGDGRRVFRADEFDRRTGHHIATSGKYTVPHPAKTLIREDVNEVGSGDSVAISKMAFAQAVRDETPPFDGLSFEGFRPTFELIDEAVRAVAGEVRRGS